MLLYNKCPSKGEIQCIGIKFEAIEAEEGKQSDQSNPVLSETLYVNSK